MEEYKIPKHVSIIMDGNGRWATRRGLKRSEGHLAGSKTLEKLAIHAIDKGVEVLSVYAFSTDNFKREQAEVDYLMNLFIKMFSTKFVTLKKKGIKVVFSGRRINLRDDVLKAMDKIVNETKDNTRGILNVCLNYGGQEEIVDAVKKILSEGVDPDTIDKNTMYHYLYNDLPPIDLLIRTSGECRVSNYMIYQMAYSEFYFTDCLFPDFLEDEFDKAIDAYNGRDIRLGGNSEKEE